MCSSIKVTKVAVIIVSRARPRLMILFLLLSLLGFHFDLCNKRELIS